MRSGEYRPRETASGPPSAGAGAQPLPHNPRKQRKNPAAAGSGERFREGKWRRGWDWGPTFSALASRLCRKVRSMTHKKPCAVASSDDCHSQTTRCTLNLGLQSSTADPQIAQSDRLKKTGQHRVMHLHASMRRIEAKAEAGSEERNRRRGRPSLRHAGNRIEGRALTATARESAEEFRKPAQFDMNRRVEQRLEDSRRFGLEAVARETRCDYCVVVRPDRTIVIPSYSSKSGELAGVPAKAL